MLYRNFAIATLLGAPLLVMVVEAVVPKSQPAAETSAATAAPAPVTPVPPSPSIVMPQAPPVAAMPDYGQPLPGAGQPLIVPSSNMPTTASGPIFSSRSAPPGSPNAE
ncbi:hypothetical protein [Sphingobium sp. RAC03]|uniref:hypothetical protein n=1 Tax=Sphingobium sp. RAC03 TaxID=1843368 RepID=UPI00083E0308|nr:hypothetical protein [Sphingobium sp. RAC03]AOF98353.1 hypothetical protein BSY17_2106 [Sphingobium sp. RAC03]